MDIEIYQLIIYKQKKEIYFSKPNGLTAVLLEFLNRLDNLNALDIAVNGVFNEQYVSLTNKTHSKQYIVNTIIPEQKFIIKKISKGNIHREYFISKLKILKEKFKNVN